MKYIITIILTFTFSILIAQVTDSAKSHTIEIEGWELFFDGNKIKALEKFKKAMELNPKNILAKIGFFNSTSENELSQGNFDLIKDFPKEENKSYSYSEISFQLLMNGQIEKKLSDSLKIMRNKYDGKYIRFKAALTDSKFEIKDESGDIRKEGFFKNRNPSGTWKFFGYKNKLHHSYTYPVQGGNVIAKYYKSDGDVIRQEWLKGNPFIRESKKVKEVIYWQENPGKKPEYLLVSKNGFIVYKNGKVVELDENTPDNIIGRKWNSDKKQFVAYIWKNGKKEPYELCEDDGMVISETIDNVRKTYRWENCKKILIETKKLE